MRILMISDHADPLAEIGSKEAGGQNIYVFYLAKFLSHMGIFVDVYTRWDRRNKKEVVKFNNHLRIIRIKAGPKKYMSRDQFLSVVDEFYEKVFRRVKKEKLKYDIIHTNYWYSGVIGMRLAKKLNIPMVHVYHSIGKIRYETLKSFKMQKGDDEFFKKRIEIEGEIAHHSSEIVSTSPVEKKILTKLFGISENKIKVIPIGVDSKIFKPVSGRKMLKTKEKVILYVGRIEWRKGLGTLIYAMREIKSKYPDIKLKIVGGGKSLTAKKLEGAECDRLKKIVRDLELSENVEFLGAKKQKILKRYYSSADVCVVPSYYEPYGIVPVESMACGTPVVASRTGGLQFTVVDGITGELAEPRSYKDLAEKIKIVLKKGKKYYQNNCLDRVKEKFEWIEIIKQYNEYFNQLINKK